MAKAVKWTLGILGIAILATVAAVYVVLTRLDLESFKPRIAEMVFQSTGRKLSMDGRIDLAFGLTPAIVVENVRLANAAWGSRPDMVLLKRLEVKAALRPLLRGKVEILRFVLTEPDILIETSPRGASNLRFRPQGPVAVPSPQPPQAPTAMKLPALTLQDVIIENGRLTLRDGKTGKVETLLLTRLQAAGQDLDSPLSLDADLSYKDQRLSVNADFGSIATLVDPSKPWSVKAVVKAAVADLNVDGTIRDPLTGQGIDLGIALKSGDLAALAALAGQTITARLPVSLSGRIQDKGAKAFRIEDLQAVVGPSDLSGTVALNLAGKRPHVTAVLSSRAMEVKPSDQGAAPATVAAPVPAPAAVKLFPDARIDFRGLNQIDADVRIACGRIALPQVQISDLDMQLDLVNGRLDIQKINAKIAEGTIAGHGLVNAGGALPEVAATIGVRGFNLGKMLNELNMQAAVEGLLDADVNVAGRGESVAAIMAGLNGHTTVKMANGAIHNGYLDMLGGDVVSGLLKLLVPAQGEANTTAVHCLVSRLDIRNGQADTTVLVADTAIMTVIGDGRIDLAKEILDIGFETKAKKGVAGVSLSLGEMAKPFRLSGTLAQPTVGFDRQKAAVAVGKAIGGAALLGPAGLAALLVGESGDQDPCPAALEAARTGVKPAPAQPQAGTASRSTTSNPLKQIGDKIKGLFK